MRRLRSLLAADYRSIVRPIARLAGRLLGFVPALLAGTGVFLVVAGLFYYLQPVAAEPLATPTAATATGSSNLYSLPPPGSPAPSGSAALSASPATRLVIPALGMDLPVILSPSNEDWPLCDVAEVLPLDHAHEAPGLPQATYLYAHSQAGMFLPLLTQSKINDGRAMLGMWAELYTDDNQRHVYEITQVIRGVPNAPSALDRARDARTDQLWLQASEGPYETSTKLQVVAMPIGEVAATAADAHPAGKGRVCPGAPRCSAANRSGCRP
ncbi:MAG: hypothetical protein ABSE70_03255 [Candidatus Limnocylindrales bacterium]